MVDVDVVVTMLLTNVFVNTRSALVTASSITPTGMLMNCTPLVRVKLVLTAV